MDPVRDMQIIFDELRFKDIQMLQGAVEKMEKLVVRGNEKARKFEFETLLKVVCFVAVRVSGCNTSSVEFRWLVCMPRSVENGKLSYRWIYTALDRCLKNAGFLK